MQSRKISNTIAIYSSIKDHLDSPLTLEEFHAAVEDKLKFVFITLAGVGIPKGVINYDEGGKVTSYNIPHGIALMALMQVPTGECIAVRELFDATNTRYGDFNLEGTTTGRFSSNTPNIAAKPSTDSRMSTTPEEAIAIATCRKDALRTLNEKQENIRAISKLSSEALQVLRDKQSALAPYQPEVVAYVTQLYAAGYSVYYIAHRARISISSVRRIIEEIKAIN